MAELPENTVLIGGAGIAGLSTAIALERSGYACRILERTPEFLSHGAGIQIGPNSTRILRDWGLLQKLLESACEPEGVEIRSGRSGKRLAFLPLGQTIRERYSAPYLTLHREDLHKTLLERALGSSKVTIDVGSEIRDITLNEDIVAVEDANGQPQTGMLLIGSDGVWSALRGKIAPGAHAQYSGSTAWRCVVDMDDVPDDVSRTSVGLWMSPDAHLVHYPVKSGTALNVVAVIGSNTKPEGWNSEGDRQELISRFKSWPGPARDLVQSCQGWRKWALARFQPLPKWHERRCVLIGDAAHPVLPFLAQGGGLAIEDAQVLSDCLAAHKGQHEKAFEHFTQMRMPRVTRVQETSAKMGRIYHLKGPVALARDMVLRLSSSRRLLERYNWLYGYRTG